jgi:protein TonB
MKAFYFLFFQFFVVISSVNAQANASKDSLVHPLTKTDSALVKVEIESSFPGGEAGWLRFLKSSLVYPAKAVRKKVEGTVVVQFIVEKDGSLSDIEAISGPDLLWDAAVKVIKASPNWKPAVQYGKKVKSYKKQPIAFRLTP